MSNNKVLKKILYYVDITCVSPVCVSGGDTGLTDKDVLRDSTGKPFIAGSSLAGAMRNYLGYLKTEQCIFGYSSKDGSDGKMSSVFLSDVELDGNIKTAVRDGIKLTDDKTTETSGKYDMEVVETGTKGHFSIEVIVRDGDNEEEMQSQICQVLNGLESGEIRLGARKTRGFGQVEITAIRCKEYTAENILEYQNAYDKDTYEQFADCKETIFSKGTEDRKYVHIQVPLKLQGGISVRRYSAKKGEPDYVHLTSDGKPVIPGTSYNGAIRHRVKEVLTELKVPKVEEILDTLFGYVDKRDAHKSGVIIGESIIKGGKPLTMVRNAISRFEGAAKDGALYKERSHFEGTTTLNLYVEKELHLKGSEKSDGIDVTDWMIGILLIALKDIQNGYLPIGGQTAIGRGVLLADGEISIDGSTDKTEDYLKNSLQIREVLQ